MDSKSVLAQSSPTRSQSNETRGMLDNWQLRRSDGLARLFPSWNRWWNSPEHQRDTRKSRPAAAERSEAAPDATGDAELHATRPVTRFRDVLPEIDENQTPSAVAQAASPAPRIASLNEGAVLRASLLAQESPASIFTQNVVPPLAALQTGLNNLTKTSPVPALQPAPAPATDPAVIASTSSAEPDNLLPQSLMRDSDGPADPPLALGPAQDQAPSSKSASTSTPPQQKNSTSTPPPPRRTPPAPATSTPPPPSAEPKKSATTTKPAADEMKLQSPEVEPAAAIEPPPAPAATQVRPQAPKNASSPPTPPSASAPAAASEPAAPSASAPAASGPAPIVSGTASAGYAQSPAVGPAPQELTTWPSLDGALKTAPSAQLPTPLFSSSYDFSTPVASPQILAAPQGACCGCGVCQVKTKKCKFNLQNCILVRKLKCLMAFIHEHCPLKKKFWKNSCQNCTCCSPTYFGTMASPQGFFGSLQSAPISMPVIGNPATPQASGSPGLFSPLSDREQVEAKPDSLLALEPSTGTKPGDVAQGGDDLKPIAPQGLDETP
jgi:hypothetical protein